VPRIITGQARGRRLAVPPGERTRPTADRIKEALFSALSSDPGLVGRRVLDLYAGSGGLGLEAASRGASQVELVESDPRALAVLRANVAAVGLPQVRIAALPVERFLAGTPDRPWDLVLADPPYSLDVTAELERLVTGGWLADAAVVVVERSSRVTFSWPRGLTPLRDRRYGETTLCYGLRA
jgi:16S rRNA (guanine966-N2)-methyltransferase